MLEKAKRASFSAKVQLGGTWILLLHIQKEVIQSSERWETSLQVSTILDLDRDLKQFFRH